MYPLRALRARPDRRLRRASPSWSLSGSIRCKRRRRKNAGRSTARAAAWCSVKARPFLRSRIWRRLQARGAEILAEITGYGLSTDNHHLTQPHPSGIGPRQAMERALQSAGLAPQAIDYINAHGTATPFNDAAEGKAIADLFGRVPVSSTKGMMGHSLGAAGAIEAVITILALRNQFSAGQHQFPRLRSGARSRYRREQGPPGPADRRALQFVRLRRNQRIDRDPDAGRMNLRLAGLGWVTPLGQRSDEVWQLLMARERPARQLSADSLGERSISGFPVPPAAIAEAAPASAAPPLERDLAFRGRGRPGRAARRGPRAG